HTRLLTASRPRVSDTYGDEYDDLLHDRRFHPGHPDGSGRCAVRRRASVQNGTTAQRAAGAWRAARRGGRGRAGRRSARAGVAKEKPPRGRLFGSRLLLLRGVAHTGQIAWSVDGFSHRLIPPSV